MDCAVGVQPRKATTPTSCRCIQRAQQLVIPQSALLCNSIRYAGFGKFAVGILTQPTTSSAAANSFQNAKVKSYKRAHVSQMTTVYAVRVFQLLSRRI